MTTAIQPDLFETAPYQQTSDTSRIAALSQVKVGTQKFNILMLLAFHGGKTEDEIEVELDMRRSAVCGRINSLVHQDQRVRDSGNKRLTRFGRPAVVWELIPLEEQPS